MLLAIGTFCLWSTRLHNKEENMAATRVVEVPERQVASALWWIIMFEAVLAILFGIAAVFWPGLTLVVLVYLFSAYVLIWGISELVHGLMSIRRRGTWWLTAILGVVGLGVGVYLIRHPHVSFATLILLIGLTLIVRGVLEVVGGFLDQLSSAQRALSIFVGVLAVIAGIIVLLQPVAGGVAFVWVLGLYALIYGALLFVLSLEARSIYKELLDEE
jgi:uncharacterized membrane protein HdeD (DUF308 family)